MSQYPEHDRLEAVRSSAQEIREFLWWLQANYWVQGIGDIELLLLEFYGLDQEKLKSEADEIARSVVD